MRLFSTRASLGLDPEKLIRTFGTIGLFAIIFAESGIMIGFFLPGDSLLFVTGLFIGAGTIDVNIWVACILLTIAAIAGNVSGYWIGRKSGPALFKNPDARFLTPANVEKTHAFFEKYGPRSIILARFVPIVRTFITVLAGVGKMDFRHFLVYSSIGGVLWAGGITLLGYLLGDVPWVKNNIEIIAILIVVLSVLPAGFEWLKARREHAQAEPAADES